MAPPRRRAARLVRLGLALATLAGVATPPARLAAQDFEVEEATIAEVHAAFASGDLTCEGLVRRYLARIDAYDDRGPSLNAIAVVNPAALDEARALDAAFQADGLTGPLHCIPVLLKDQVETREMPTTYGSVLFEGFVSGRDATIVTRMESAGALIIAKTNMGEFASRYVGSGFGVIRNAYDPTRNPSGSSGGTGSAVAANFGMVGIGEDTGGSIRGPAAVASLVGLRPTLPLVSRHGMMPANPTTDTVGPMTRTVRDAAILLDAIAGYDPDDPVTAYSVGRMPASYAAALNADALDADARDREGQAPRAGFLRGARLGVIREPMDRSVDTLSAGYVEVRARMEEAIGTLRELGAEVIDVRIPDLGNIGGVFGRNSYETEEATNAYLRELADPPHETLASILLTGRVNPWRARGMARLLGKTTRDPGYLQYLLAREQVRVDVIATMAEYDLDAFIHATFDHPPSPIAPDVETNPAPEDRYGHGDNRALSPLTGFPALTIPAGFTTGGLPVGLEFLGRPFTEALLLQFGHAFEQATRHRRPPPTTPALDPQ